MAFENYTMGFRAIVSAQRYHELRAGLLDPWEIVVLYQDMIEAECLPVVRLQGAYHFLETGLCRFPDQMSYQ